MREIPDPKSLPFFMPDDEITAVELNKITYAVRWLLNEMAGATTVDGASIYDPKHIQEFFDIKKDPMIEELRKIKEATCTS